MGAWGTGVFENDDAADFVVEVANADAGARRDVIVAAFDAVADENDYVEIDTGSAAIAAAALLSRPFREPQDGDEVLDGLDVELNADLAKRAVAAVERVLQPPDSEWRGLWEEGDDFAEAEAPVRQILEALRVKAE